MKREFVLKFSQTIPPEYMDTRKSTDEVSKILVDTIKKELFFNGEIEVIEAKETECNINQFEHI